MSKSVRSVQLVFSGDCSSPGRNGDKLSVNCKIGTAPLDSRLPYFVRGTVCNHLHGSNSDGANLISAGCTNSPINNLMFKANWKFTAKIGAPISNAFPYTIHLTNLARSVGPDPTYFDNWFAPGWIELGAGADIERRQIIGSTTPAAGALAIKVHRLFTAALNIGDDVVLFPGCDGLYDTCKAYGVSTNPTGKFGNDLNFGSDPLTPTGNPSIVGPKTLGVNGAKK